MGASAYVNRPPEPTRLATLHSTPGGTSLRTGWLSCVP
jgi:hypothetical protein